ncbi:MAG TPA: carboxymuconolactone decarboxylase family protein [Amycolatopsis sp.]|nr:carboxymuconolactone decarboxylase family protein [Amycolatopsis sp.]
MNARIDMMGNDTAKALGKRFAGLSMQLHNSSLPQSTQELVSLRASQINGCGFCTDMHTKDATAAGETAERLFMVAAWREATVFTDAERAALALTEEGTRIADGGSVSDETWAEVQKHYDEDQQVLLIFLVGLINAANRMNVITRTPTGFYQPAMRAAFTN